MFVTLSVIVGVLDILYADDTFGQSLLIESNSVILDFFILGILIAGYDYRRRRNEAVHDLETELNGYSC